MYSFLSQKFDSKEEITKKVKILSEWILKSKHVVVHTGAGLSTSAGIPDFRGPNGVWTLEAKGMKPDINVSFNDAVPTKTHMALVKLVQQGIVKYIVSQNIDGLHLRSGIPRTNLAELHGNMFIEQCNKCLRQFVRNSATVSVGQKNLNKPCPTVRLNGRPCRGQMHDVILDWEHSLPERDLGLADFHSCVADLSICLGTTLQIIPSGNLPLHTKKYGEEGKLVICNLQPTKHDRKADLLIHGYIDDVMSQLMKFLELDIPEYNRENDPVCSQNLTEWTILESQVSKMRKIYESDRREHKLNQLDNKTVKNVKLKREIKEDSSDNGITVDIGEIKKIKKENDLNVLKLSEGSVTLDCNKIKVEKPE